MVEIQGCHKNTPTQVATGFGYYGANALFSHVAEWFSFICTDWMQLNIVKCMMNETLQIPCRIKHIEHYQWDQQETCRDLTCYSDWRLEES